MARKPPPPIAGIKRTPSSRPHKQSGRWWRWLLFVIVMGGLVGVAGVAAVFVYYNSDPDLPHIGHVDDYHPKLVSKILAAGGELIGEIYEERRTVVPREKIPPAMIHAIVDAEDAEFYQHAGLSYMGLARAVLRDLRPGAHLQGASTLTQQLVRNLILKTSAQTVKRKVQEMILARRLDAALSKDEILALYLNQIDFGHGRFGVEEAARYYFGKSISDVDAGEAALLASLPKGPSEIDPWKHPERAKERQRYVLSQMVRYHHLDEAAAQKFAAAPIMVVRSPEPYLGIAPEVTDEIKQKLVDKFGQQKLAMLGIEVQTTIDVHVQQATRDAVEKGLIDLDARQGYRKPNGHLKPAQIPAQLAKLARELPNGPPYGKILEGVVTEIVIGHPSSKPLRAGERDPAHDGDGLKIGLGAVTGWLPLPLTLSNGGTDRYNPKGLTVDKRFAVGDELRVSVIDMPKGKAPVVKLELGPEASAVVIDPQTRQVKAMVGGYGFRAGAFNRAKAAERQPGSSFKPFVYAAAFATQKWTPASVLIDGPQTYATPGLAPWKPQNSEKDEFMGPVRLRVALAKSLNTIASQLVDVERGGVDPVQVVTLAKDCGIGSELQSNPSLALGSSEVNLLELTNAYATFADGGKRLDPMFILRMGAEIEEQGNASDALRPELAYVMTSMMTSVIEEGTAASARGKLGRPAAGKTGTVVGPKGAHTDAWFVGYTPDLAVGVWVGFDDRHELGHGEQGAHASLPIWVDIVKQSLAGKPARPFVQPPGVVVAKIDPSTGLLASPGASNAIDEVFLEGSEPKQVAPAAGEANPDTFAVDQQ